MPLSTGQKLGPYEIDSPAGAGGMGEVYKAKDTRLDRIVAIKVLPERTAQNEAMRARFEREAKTISSLNHPNICTLYDIGHENNIDYIVMEYLEGETISERIKKGPMPIDEALTIASEVADALDKAHHHGLIHRDLKPANVILTKEGAKLLDFGLAKLNASDSLVEGISAVTQSTPLTGTGTIVGTIQYMSPEQLEGSNVDSRSDIFAFGAMLYQMLTGKRPFDGKSQANLIAAIIERAPDPISSILPLIPPGIDRLVRKCLEKDPDRRWQSAHDLADEIRWLAQAGSQVGIPAPVAAKRKLQFRLGWAVASVAILLAMFYASKWHGQSQPTKNLIRFDIEPNIDIQSISWPQISPDGSLLAFKAADQYRRERIWIRPLNANEAYPLNGTEGALRPFWSPDSKSLAFSVGQNQLKKVPVGGGPAQLIGEFERVTDGSWGSKGAILFDGANTDSIWIIAASGGEARPATSLDREKGQLYHAWPEFLPDGEHFLFLSSNDSTYAGFNYILEVGSTTSSEVLSLFPVHSRVKYCDPGYIVYVNDKTLLAQPFDADKLELTGEPVPIAENISSPFRSPIASFDVADDGTLVYLTSDASIKNELIWVDRTGQQLATVMEPARYSDIALSPDGKQLVYGIEDPQTETSDLWMYDLNREVSTRFTFDPAVDWGPIWSHDGSSVFFNRGTLPAIIPYMKPSNGTAEAKGLVSPDYGLAALSDVSNDGQLLCLTTAPNGQPDLELMKLDSDSAITPLLNTDRGELGGYFSPDGKYMIYTQQQPGGEMFVLELGGSGGKWQVSTNGASSYRWSPDGTELLYFNNNWEMISVPISTKNGLEIGKASVLFKHKLSKLQLSGQSFDVTDDGQRFILVSAFNQENVLKFNIVLNWPEMLNEQR